VPGGQSAWGTQTVREEPADLVSCSSCVLACLCFDPFCPVLLVAWSLSDGPRGGCGQSLLRGLSAGRPQTVYFSGCSTGGLGAIFRGYAPVLADGLPRPRRRSAPCSRMVRSEPRTAAKSFAS
jgi:hypothetical protein